MAKRKRKKISIGDIYKAWKIDLLLSLIKKEKNRLLVFLEKNKPVLKIASISLITIIVIVSLVFFIKNRKDIDNLKINKEGTNNISNTSSSEPTKVVETDTLNEPLPENSEVITQGRFNNVEQNVEGKALFIKSGKERFLRLENFNSLNGQDIHVYLSPILNLDKNDAIDLGQLKALSGQFSYPLDSSVDIERFNNVIIWCNPFNAFFGYASLLTKELPKEPVLEPEPEIDLENNNKLLETEESELNNDISDNNQELPDSSTEIEIVQ